MGAGTQPPPPIHSSQAPPSAPRIKRNLVRRLVEQFNEEARLRDRDGQSEHTTPVMRAPYVIESNSRNAHKQYNYGKKDQSNQRIWHHPQVDFSTRTPPTKPHRRKTKAVQPEDAPTNERVMYHRLERADENHVNEDDLRRHRATPTYFFGQRMQNSDSLHRSSLASNSSGGSLGEGDSSLLSAKLVRRADKRVSAHVRNHHSPEAGYRASTPTIIPIRLEHNNNHNNGKANGAGHYTPPVRTSPPIRVQIDPPSPPTTPPTSDGEGRDFVDGELIERARGLNVDRRKSRSRSFGGADAEPRRVYFSAHPPKVPSTANGEVITHAAAIADIPPPPNQRVSRTVQRSFSMLSPWAPRKPKSRPSPPSQNSSSAAYSTSSSRSHSPALGPAPVNNPAHNINGNGVSSSENSTTTLNRKPKSKEKVKVRRRHSMPKGFLFLRKKRPQ